jgi:NAD(P)-dependent dehydrogenase (short-subunit alcohol dehydrogenase family)
MNDHSVKDEASTARHHPAGRRRQEPDEGVSTMAWTVNDMPDQTGRIAVITGANSGLGLEASRELARKGATVVMAVRNMEKGQAAADGIKAEIPAADLELRELDLGSLGSVRAFAATVREQHDHIDILLNNAGLMATPAGQTADGFETQVGTNHLGHFVLTEELMPLLQAAKAARVVTMTSVARAQGRPLTEDKTRLDGEYKPWQAYGDSKLANYQFGIELARRLEAAGSSVSSLVAHPGLSRTNLQVATVENAGVGVSGRFWQVVARYAGMKPLDGTLPALRAATDPAARNGQVYGPRWTMRGAPVAIDLEEKRADKAATERMWRISEAETGTVFSLGK